MKLNSMMKGAPLAVLALAALTVSPAVSAPASSHAAAISACTTANDYQPVDVVTGLDNGAGYTLVWLTDTDGDLWMCHANNQGSIYAYEYVSDDLLEGEGPSMIDLRYDTASNPVGDPQNIAERVCNAAAPLQPARVIASRPDGLSEEDYVAGFSVFLQDDVGDTYLCNASSDASIWTWSQIGDPFEIEGVS